MLDTIMEPMLDGADLFMYDCDECAGMPLAPPPQFLIPPPPRPPALAEYTVVPQDCNEEQLAQQQWESDVCQAMPVSVHKRVATLSADPNECPLPLPLPRMYAT